MKTLLLPLNTILFLLLFTIGFQASAQRVFNDSPSFNSHKPKVSHTQTHESDTNSLPANAHQRTSSWQFQKANLRKETPKTHSDSTKNEKESPTFSLNLITALRN